MPKGPIRRRKDGTFEVSLGANEREVLAEVAGQFRALLMHETPSSDPSLQRLFPPAHPDDPIAELEYEDAVGASSSATGSRASTCSSGRRTRRRSWNPTCSRACAP